MGTVVNIRAGGRTRVAGALCAVLLLAVVLGLGRYVGSIPHAVLAGILIKVGWDIVDWRFITHLHRVQREHLLVMVVTLGLTVFADLVTAVVLGLVAAGMASARQFERLELDNVISVPLLDEAFLTDSTDTEGPHEFLARVGLVALRGTFTVASSNKLIATLGADVRDHEVVIIDFSGTVYMDDSAALVVEQLIDVAMDEKGELADDQDVLAHHIGSRSLLGVAVVVGQLRGGIAGYAGVPHHPGLGQAWRPISRAGLSRDAPSPAAAATARERSAERTRAMSRAAHRRWRRRPTATPPRSPPRRKWRLQLIDLVPPACP